MKAKRTRGGPDTFEVIASILIFFAVCLFGSGFAYVFSLIVDRIAKGGL